MRNILRSPALVMDPNLKPDTRLPRQLGATLRARRKLLAINMTAAAEAAGISRVTWYRLEKGEPTVALGSLLAAARVLGLELALRDPDERPVREPGPPERDWLPLTIRLADYPQLRQLAWQIGDASETLTPREALGLYERNWRHLDAPTLEPHERALIKALRHTFGTRSTDV